MLKVKNILNLVTKIIKTTGMGLFMILRCSHMLSIVISNPFVLQISKLH